MKAGRYRLLRVLGQGGMGRVWQGRDELLGRDVALKEIALAAGLTQELRAQLIERTLREAKAAARLSHPGIVTVHDVLLDGGEPWIVMELISGISLGEQLRANGPLPWHHAAQIGQQVATALAHAHALGVVHRDLKPENIVLAPRGAVLMDFGIARIADATHQLTSTGTAIGTPHFMSPEQLEGGKAGPSTDLWSLGATLYAATHGTPPFDGPTLTAIYAAILTQPAPEPTAAGPLAPTISALLTKDPAHRPNATDTIELLSALPQPAAHTPFPTPTPQPAAEPAPQAGTTYLETAEPPPSAASTQHGRFRNPKPLALAASLIAVAGLVAGYLLSHAAPGGFRQLWINSTTGDSNNNATLVGGEVIDRTDAQVTAYSADSHTQLWTWHQSACDFTATADGRDLLVQYDPITGDGTNAGECQQLMAIDLKTGKPAWRSPAGIIPANYTGQEPSVTENVNVAGKTAVVLEDDDNVRAFNTATGDLEWTTSGFGNDPNCSGKDETYQADDAVASTDTLYVLTACTAQASGVDYVAQYSMTDGAYKGYEQLPESCDGDATSDNDFAFASYTSGYLSVDCADTANTTNDLPQYVSEIFQAGPSGMLTPAPAALNSALASNDSANFIIYHSTLYNMAGPNGDIQAISLPSGRVEWTRPSPKNALYLAQSDDRYATVAVGPAGIELAWLTRAATAANTASPSAPSVASLDIGTYSASTGALTVDATTAQVSASSDNAYLESEGGYLLLASDTEGSGTSQPTGPATSNVAVYGGYPTSSVD